MRGGHEEASEMLRRFVKTRLAGYADQHNHPDADGTSHLSPYLHFGHIAAHEVFASVMTYERWTTRRLAKSAGGARDGWWNVSPSAETFLDQLVVWRDLAFNGSAWTPGFEHYDTLPAWARATLDAHRTDPRPHLYDLATLETASTDDEVWNAAQRQLVRDGWFHGYMRMLWGKKILEWSSDPETALIHMEHLMNRYSLDGRDPVSYASFGWVLGRYDRPWFERPIFGTVRYMTSQSARRKLHMREYLRKYGQPTVPC
jgi:deoxyribodipyrimidine photo-lyase